VEALAEMREFAVSLEEDQWPLFGRDVVRLIDAYRALLARLAEAEAEQHRLADVAHQHYHECLRLIEERDRYRNALERWAADAALTVRLVPNYVRAALKPKISGGDPDEVARPSTMEGSQAGSDDAYRRGWNAAMTQGDQEGG
jgi:hypothetical protein